MDQLVMDESLESKRMEAFFEKKFKEHFLLHKKIRHGEYVQTHWKVDTNAYEQLEVDAKFHDLSINAMANKLITNYYTGSGFTRAELIEKHQQVKEIEAQYEEEKMALWNTWKGVNNHPPAGLILVGRRVAVYHQCARLVKVQEILDAKGLGNLPELPRSIGK